MKESPAKKEQGQSMEDIFRNGLAGAESAPSPRLWENIDRELENHELHGYRQQVKWYRSIAAVFLLLFVSVGLYLWQQEAAPTLNQGGKLASQQSSSIPEVRSEGSPKEGAEGNEPLAVPGQSEGGAKERPEQLASVSGAVPEKRALNRTRRAATAEAVKKDGFGVAADNRPQALAQHKTVPTSQAQPEAPAGLPILENKKTESTAASSPEPAVSEITALERFPKAMTQSLALTPGLSITGDSLLPGPQKSIMVQKKEEGAVVAQTVPAGGKGNETETTGVYKWSLTMAYSPQYAYSPVKLENGSSMGSKASSIQQSQVSRQYQEAVEEYNNSYSPAYSYAALVGASYRINDKWQVESGVLYTQNEATTTQSYLVYGSRGTMDFGFTGNTSASPTAGKGMPLVTSALQPEAAMHPVSINRTDQYTTRYRYQKVGLPVRLAYRISHKKAYALISGGVNMNFLVQNSIVPETDQVETVRFGLSDENSPFRTVQWATTTSVGLGYDVTRKMSFMISPEFTYSLTPMVRDQPRQGNMYQLGVSIGGRWRLAK
ncbi:outer membrane beta-barrel protein [Rufibacter glacialis]|uniref:Outer membrane beta-barrel protein n=1 Tax=Rufibacter glacialis TaxID=1259555 RepID=A0A5M8QLY2_9BACT|nr:outer membrane beta-barrel protein [Rufibacter glacialis]KAA6437237.1 outer membrane beta-barrel protein [Rufibacter glacialis]GGK60871.1 hypothetical protein GCM10011405_06320 [Rufibacter glacialis]